MTFSTNMWLRLKIYKFEWRRYQHEPIRTNWQNFIANIIW